MRCPTPTSKFIRSKAYTFIETPPVAFLGPMHNAGVYTLTNLYKVFIFADNLGHKRYGTHAYTRNA